MRAKRSTSAVLTGRTRLVAAAGIDDVLERLARQEAAQVVEEAIHRPVEPTRHLVRAVRREQEVVEGEERMPGGQGLGLEHVERRAPDRPAAQRVHERPLLHDWPAAAG